MLLIIHIHKEINDYFYQSRELINAINTTYINYKETNDAIIEIQEDGNYILQFVDKNFDYNKFTNEEEKAFYDFQKNRYCF